MPNNPATRKAGATQVSAANKIVRRGAQAAAITSAVSRGNPQVGAASTPDTAAIPPGIIAMWSGAFADVPSGWALCDGSNGTPDLTDRFILGTNTEGEVGNVGGVKTHKHNLIAADTPAGTATVTAASAGTPAGTLNSTGAHTHTFTQSSNAASPTLLAVDTTPTGVAAAGTTSSDGAHSHIFTGNALGTHTHLLAGKTAVGETVAGNYGTNDILPPFFKLAFIMKLP